jgi:hypothetical protein
MELGKQKFNEIAENEKVIRVVHRHWFDIFEQYLIVIAIILVVAAGVFIFPSVFFKTGGASGYALTFFIATTLLIITWIYSFLVWVDYYFDMWIITSERVVNIEQKGLFLREVSELKYNKVQDVTADVKGLFPTVLNYGDVHIQTAAEEERFFFRHIPNPYEIKNIIMELVKNREINKTNEISELIKEVKE